MKIPIKQILTEATRWKEEAGNLSKQSIKKLYKERIPKPDSILADSIWTGTKNILKKHLPETEINYQKMSGKLNMQSGGAYFDPGSVKKNTPPSVNVDKDPNFMRRLFSDNDKVFQSKETGLLNKALDGRHEAYEAKYDKGYPEAKGQIYSKDKSLKNKLLGRDEYLHIGNHNTAKVLADEAKDINKLQYTTSGQNYKKMRNEETNIIKNYSGVDLTGANNKNISSIKKQISQVEAKPNFIGYH
jgi:hypothetical protein